MSKMADFFIDIEEVAQGMEKNDLTPLQQLCNNYHIDINNQDDYTYIVDSINEYLVFG